MELNDPMGLDWRWYRRSVLKADRRLCSPRGRLARRLCFPVFHLSSWTSNPSIHRGVSRPTFCWPDSSSPSEVSGEARGPVGPGGKHRDFRARPSKHTCRSRKKECPKEKEGPQYHLAHFPYWSWTSLVVVLGQPLLEDLQWGGGGCS